MKKYKHYIIYKITNLINGKIYIGKHKCNKLDDNYFGSGKCLQQAINKYGIENFIFHLEIDLTNQTEMDLLEEYVVNEDFLKRDDVYNISRGGKNPCMYGKDNPFYGKTHTDKFKKKMSSILKGKKLSQQHKNNISIGLKKLMHENPEIKIKFATRKNKKKCKNKNTGQIKFFKIDQIPNEFEFLKRKKYYKKLTEEQKIESINKKRIRAQQSKWYNNGIKEIFCLKENVPDGFVLGRLPTTNIGRKLSKETKEKIRKSKIGKIPNNKGKVFITNGIKNKYISKVFKLPDGWKYGLTRKKK